MTEKEILIEFLIKGGVREYSMIEIHSLCERDQLKIDVIENDKYSDKKYCNRQYRLARCYEKLNLKTNIEDII